MYCTLCHKKFQNAARVVPVYTYLVDTTPGTEGVDQTFPDYIHLEHIPGPIR
jgi:hypothetical protein